MPVARLGIGSQASYRHGCRQTRRALRPRRPDREDRDGYGGLAQTPMTPALAGASWCWGGPRAIASRPARRPRTGLQTASLWRMRDLRVGATVAMRWEAFAALA